jgi:hypothetical protein
MYKLVSMVTTERLKLYMATDERQLTYGDLQQESGWAAILHGGGQLGHIIVRDLEGIFKSSFEIHPLPWTTRVKLPLKKKLDFNQAKFSYQKEAKTGRRKELRPRRQHSVGRMVLPYSLQDSWP